MQIIHVEVEGAVQKCVQADNEQQRDEEGEGHRLE